MLAIKSFRKLRTNLPQAIFDQSHINAIFFSPINSTKKTKEQHVIVEILFSIQLLLNRNLWPLRFGLESSETS